MAKETEMVCVEMLKFITGAGDLVPLHDAFTRMKWIRISGSYSSSLEAI